MKSSAKIIISVLLQPPLLLDVAALGIIIMGFVVKAVPLFRQMLRYSIANGRHDHLL